MDSPVPDLGLGRVVAIVASAVTGQIIVLSAASRTMVYALLRPDSQ